MLLSKILSEAGVPDEGYQIYREQEFDTLGLLASEIDRKICSFLAGEKYLDLVTDRVSMLITTPNLAERFYESNVGICITENPRLLFFHIHNYLAGCSKYIRKEMKTEIGKGTYISDKAVIADTNVIIGNNVIIEEFAVIRSNTVIGDNSIIRAGVKIGGEGFEFKRTDDDIEAVKHLGGVKIGANVEIQYNSCIDRAVYPWDDTVIADYCKVDNLVHIAHAVKLRERTMVVAQSGIGGRTIIGPDTWIGFSATVSNGLHIGENCRANIGAVVTKDVENNKSVTGNFAIDHQKFIEDLKGKIRQ